MARYILVSSFYKGIWRHTSFVPRSIYVWYVVIVDHSIMHMEVVENPRDHKDAKRQRLEDDIAEPETHHVAME